MKRILVLLLLVGCDSKRYALCEPDIEGCGIIQIYDDILECNFVAMARNGKDYARDNLACMEIPK